MAGRPRHLIALFLIIGFAAGLLFGRYAPWDKWGLLPTGNEVGEDGKLPNPIDVFAQVWSDLNGGGGDALGAVLDAPDGSAPTGPTPGGPTPGPTATPAVDPLAKFLGRPLALAEVVDGRHLKVRAADGEVRTVRLMLVASPKLEAKGVLDKLIRGFSGRVWLQTLRYARTDTDGTLLAMAYVVPPNWTPDQPPPTGLSTNLNKYLVAKGYAQQGTLPAPPAR